MVFGFLNIYKPKWKTSHDIVAILRKLTGIKRIGHTGTLDPFAVGVLPICIGNSTRLIEYLADDKAYVATVQFGKNTDTYDVEGQIIEEFDKNVSQDELQKALRNFIGEIEQYPPMYSAVKVNGKKLYEYARENQYVEIKSRKVFIKNFKLLSFDQKLQQARLLVECSKGTYIRSLAYDLGKFLSCGGYLIELERIKSGDFLVENSVHLENLNSKEDVVKCLIDPLLMLNYPMYQLNEKEFTIVSNGGAIFCENYKDGDIVILIYGDKIKSVGIKKDKKILVKKVL